MHNKDLPGRTRREGPRGKMEEGKEQKTLAQKWLATNKAAKSPSRFNIEK